MAKFIFYMFIVSAVLWIDTHIGVSRYITYIIPAMFWIAFCGFWAYENWDTEIGNL